jgi:hypothetical protein
MGGGGHGDARHGNREPPGQTGTLSHRTLGGNEVGAKQQRSGTSRFRLVLSLSQHYLLRVACVTTPDAEWILQRGTDTRKCCRSAKFRSTRAARAVQPTARGTLVIPACYATR